MLPGVHRPRLGLLSATISVLLSFPLACDSWKKESAQNALAEASEPVDANAIAQVETPEEIEKWMDLENRQFPLLIWSAQTVQSDYHAPEKFDLELQLDAALDSISRDVPEFFHERKGDAVLVKVGSKSQSFKWPKELSFRDGAAWLEPVLVFVRDELGLEVHVAPRCDCGGDERWAPV